MTWSEWFAANQDELAELLRSDAEEALFKAYLAGIEHGGSFVAEMHKPFWKIVEDK